MRSALLGIRLREIRKHFLMHLCFDFYNWWKIEKVKKNIQLKTMYCAEIHWSHQHDTLQIYPILFLGFGGSFCAMMTGGASLINCNALARTLAAQIQNWKNKSCWKIDGISHVNLLRGGLPAPPDPTRKHEEGCRPTPRTLSERQGNLGIKKKTKSTKNWKSPYSL